MAKKQPRRKSTKKQARGKATKQRARGKSTKSATSRRPLLKHKPTPGLYGWITHTELQSADPLATKSWCAKVLGWTFTHTMPMPAGGDYHLFAYSDQGGGGIRGLMPSESPGSSFTVHVADAHEAFARALTEGAEPVTPPMRVMDGVTIAVVKAPGGVRVGFSGP